MGPCGLVFLIGWESWHDDRCIIRAPEEVSLSDGTWRKMLLQIALWLVNPIQSCYISHCVRWIYYVLGTACTLVGGHDFQSIILKIYWELWRKCEQRQNTVPLILSFMLILAIPSQAWVISQLKKSKNLSPFLLHSFSYSSWWQMCTA